jgi:hypothetical protein
MKRPIYWFTVKAIEGEKKGTDRWAFQHHWVSITPLRLDLTDEKALAHSLVRTGGAHLGNGGSDRSARSPRKAIRSRSKKALKTGKTKRAFLAVR